MGAGKGRKMDCPPQPPGGLAGPRWRSLGCEPPVCLRCDGGRSRRATGRAASCSGPFAGMSLRRPLQAGSSRSSGLGSNPSSSERPAETPRTPPLPHGRLQSPPGRTLVSQREAAWPRGRRRPPGRVPPPRPGSGIIPVRPDEHLGASECGDRHLPAFPPGPRTAASRRAVSCSLFTPLRGGGQLQPLGPSRAAGSVPEGRESRHAGAG